MASPRDKFAYNILNENYLQRHLTEKDLSRDDLARNPQKLFERIGRIDNEFNCAQKDRSLVELNSPFDFLSCEQLGESHSLLKALYSDSFLGLSEIEGKNNLVLTGPRGCGKSTVFKSLSLRHRTLIDEDKPENLNYLGIYYRCDDLYFAFPRYSLPEKEEAYDIPMHYFIATLTCELFEAIELWAKKHYENEFIGKEAPAAKRIWKILDLVPPSEPQADTLKTICFKLQKERERAVKKQRFIHTHTKVGSYCGPEALIKICEVLKQEFPFLSGKLFYFFIDDYSIPKITEGLQKNLNRLLMQRTATTFFKISTESPVSYVHSDIDGKSYVEGREFVLLNLALVYLRASPEERLNFIEDVFRRRFGAINSYPVSSLDELIGTYKMPSGNELALQIRKGEKPEIWGKEVLMELCSGDIFYIISLVQRMVANIGGTKALIEMAQNPKITSRNQQLAIRDEAGNFLNNIRRIKNGEHLVAVVTAFGNISNSYLKFRNSKNEETNPPHQASRIEPYEELSISKEAREIYNELLRYSLFIEDPRGKSRRGKVVPRLYLRLTCPH